MRKFKAEHGESVIPEGTYCYDEKGCCPYWELIVRNYNEEEYHPIEEDLEEVGYCWFLEQEDSILLWDQCKICGVKEYED